MLSGKVLPNPGFFPWPIYLTAASHAVEPQWASSISSLFPKETSSFSWPPWPKVTQFHHLTSQSQFLTDRRVSGCFRDVFTQPWVPPLLDYVQDLTAPL